MQPPPSPAWPNFDLMTECTPESRRYYSVYSVDGTVASLDSKADGQKLFKLLYRNIRIQ